ERSHDQCQENRSETSHRLIHLGNKTFDQAAKRSIDSACRTGPGSSMAAPAPGAHKQGKSARQDAKAPREPETARSPSFGPFFRIALLRALAYRSAIRRQLLFLLFRHRPDLDVAKRDHIAVVLQIDVPLRLLAEVLLVFELAGLNPLLPVVTA